MIEELSEESREDRKIICEQATHLSRLKTIFTEFIQLFLVLLLLPVLLFARLFRTETRFETKEEYAARLRCEAMRTQKREIR